MHCRLLITSAQPQQDLLVVALGVVLKKDRTEHNQNNEKNLSIVYNLDATASSVVNFTQKIMKMENDCIMKRLR